MSINIGKKSGPLLYKYPEATVATVVNIAHQLMLNKEFYVKVCHLMNLMCLDPPFDAKFLPFTNQTTSKAQLRSAVSWEALFFVNRLKGNRVAD